MTSCTIVRAFADTNVIVYAQSDDGTKTATAIKLLEAGPVISAQVVNEAVAILTRKYRFSLPDAHQVATALLTACEVVPVDAEADQVTPANGQRTVEGLLLGNVPELVIAHSRRRAVDAHRARRQRDEAQQHLEERGLAHTVRAEHRQELAWGDTEIEP